MSFRMILMMALALGVSTIYAASTSPATAPATKPATKPATASAPATFTYTGKLTTGMMAIGGETTGTVISDGKSSYELDIKDAALKTKAQGLSGKQATVKGVLTLKAGVEIAQRRIISVESIEAAANQP
jgi:hypothetical protein